MKVYIDILHRVTFQVSRGVLLLLTLCAVILTVLYEMEHSGGSVYFSDITTPLEPYASRIFAFLGTLALVAVCGLIPAAKQVQQLQVHHRKFALSMSDVMYAYSKMHATDRQEVFQLKNQFDAVRERIQWARDHPELGNFEPEILTIAAQMSEQSHNLAEIYSDKNLERAYLFLQQRSEEVEQLEERVTHAQSLESSLRASVSKIDLREAEAASQVQSHLEASETILNQIGLTITKMPGTIVPMQRAVK